MKIILAVLAVILATTTSYAVSRYNIAGKSCGEVQAILKREGAAVLRYTNRSGAILYDRYVSATRYCTGSDSARKATVPTRDKQYCPVKRCYVYSR